jgi:cobalamin-dependent methionine synthase I
MAEGLYPDDIPVPADLERHYVEQPLPELFDNLDEGLFNQRFLKLKPGREHKAEEARALLAGVKKEILEKQLIKARGVYRFFPAEGAGDEILLFDK